MGEEVKVFRAWGSPFSSRVEIALKLKGIPYECTEEDLANKSASLLKYNPIHKKIPVLLHNGKPISESLVILEYIDDTWPDNPIFPTDPYEKAVARFWSKFIDEKCIPAIWRVFWGQDGEKEKSKEEVFELLKTLENQLKVNKFFGGDTVGVVDIVASFIGFWFGVIQDAYGVVLLTKESFPKLHEWTQNFLSCSVIKENLPPRDLLDNFFRTGLKPSPPHSK